MNFTLNLVNEKQMYQCFYKGHLIYKKDPNPDLTIKGAKQCLLKPQNL